MFHIGDLWCDGKVNVAQEHLATQITLGQMDKLRLIQNVPRVLSHRVMVCCVEGEHHFIAARMAADLFQMEGWQVDFLGPDVPTASLIEIVSARRPNLLALSMTLQSNLRRTRALVNKLRETSWRALHYCRRSGGAWRYLRERISFKESRRRPM